MMHDPNDEDEDEEDNEEEEDGEEESENEQGEVIRRPRAQNQHHDVFKYVDMKGGDQTVCWGWKAQHVVDQRGHRRPRFRMNHKLLYASRVVYEAVYGTKLERKDKVLHTCDNSECVNPYHMYIGSLKDNTRDMLERERIGLKHYIVKKIMEFHELDIPANVIADHIRNQFGKTIDHTLIRKIKMRTKYKHIAWPWGDAHAAKKRVHLDRLASERASAKIANDDKQEGDT